MSTITGFIPTEAGEVDARLAEEKAKAEAKAKAAAEAAAAKAAELPHQAQLNLQKRGRLASGRKILLRESRPDLYPST